MCRMGINWVQLGRNSQRQSWSFVIGNAVASLSTGNSVVWKTMTSVTLPQKVNQKKSDIEYEVS